jgi:hypothetical protein
MAHTGGLAGCSFLGCSFIVHVVGVTPQLYLMFACHNQAAAVNVSMCVHSMYSSTASTTYTSGVRYC